MEQWQIALAGLRWLGNNKRQFVIDRTGRWEHFLFVAWKSHSWLTYAGGRWTLSIITFIDHKRMNERNKKNIRKNPMEINSFVVCLLAYFWGGETNSFACLGDWRVSEKSKKKQTNCRMDEMKNHCESVYFRIRQEFLLDFSRQLPPICRSPHTRRRCCRIIIFEWHLKLAEHDVSI